MYQSIKIIDGFSTCFRQFAATHSHCQFLHGYAIKFKLVFESKTLDEKNWVMDFAFLKHSKFLFDNMYLNDWFKFMFDHTTVVSRDDRDIRTFIELQNKGIIQLRLLDKVGCEAFAELVFSVLSLMLKQEGKDIILRSVECIENEKNSAIYLNEK